MAGRILQLFARNKQGTVPINRPTDLVTFWWWETEDASAEHEDDPVSSPDDDECHGEPDGMDEGEGDLCTDQSSNSESY